MSDCPDLETQISNLTAHLAFLDHRVSLCEAALSAAIGYIIHELPDNHKVVEGLIDHLRNDLVLPPPTPEQMQDPNQVLAWQNRLAHIEGLFERLRIWALQNPHRTVRSTDPSGSAH